MITIIIETKVPLSLQTTSAETTKLLLTVYLDLAVGKYLARL